MGFLENIATLVPKINITDILDILVVTVALFFLIRLVRGTRAVQLIKGLVGVAIILIFTTLLHLKTSNWILTSILNNWILALIVLFQPEIRLIIEQIGRGKLWNESLLSLSGNASNNLQTINILTETARKLSEKKVGALIAIERSVGLNDIINTGQPIDGDISYELLDTIFYPGTAMHDGGVVIRDGKVAASMCLFPLTSKEQENSSYGTRHRAGIGLSEITDAIVIIISEESGNISVVLEGKIMSKITPHELKEYLLSILKPSNESKKLTNIFSSKSNKVKGDDNDNV